ncbi:MAG TPA: winged helix-turn-helix domain-containing protein [Solirubrobacteraceae bacterium]|nr:winged helix-turn-helix domain-containing protein [Solirubrobacteraceae bacterium]
MIDRIRQEIQERLEQLLAEAEKLRDALAALDPRDQKSKAQPAPARRTTTTRSASRSSTRSTPSTRSSSRPAASRGSNSRTAPGATKNSVLAALEKGGAMTAGEVAAATGLGRGTVSTTLSKLAKSGTVVKADRGYKLPDGATAASASES